MLREFPGNVRRLALFGSLVLAAGCHKKVAVVQHPFVLPAPVPEPVATIPEPDPVSGTIPEPVSPPVAINPTLPPPPVTTPPRSPVPRRPAAATPAQVIPEPAPVTPTPAPALGAILSADQRKKLDADYQADVRQANKVLNAIHIRTLTPSQMDSVNQARAFISQAAHYHDRDLATAAELARRAKVLMQDLAGTH